ncbi:cache domain-containing sensor histidine kinase [Paenibacillus roseipurpureus]|uniref:Sensor histidine kinase n=1 Tax=Paenibacillus roseopurpureus TaxID=2918901 RepID=A0AA96LQ51_9BACL|nr:sensor histidine kinase [Paenibacillus sp. MBLB1832]WNR42835.1 sensor histidine kinase [Paenibacillus sp. MBLB1832]
MVKKAALVGSFFCIYGKEGAVCMKTFHPFRRYRIDNVLFFALAIFITLLVAVILMITYNFSSKEQAQNTSYYQQAMLGELNEQLTLQLKAVEQTSLAISRNMAVIDFMDLQGDYYIRNKMRQDLIRDYLHPIINSSPFIHSIQIYMREPTITDVTGYVQMIPMNYVLSEPWYPLVQKSDFTWIGQRLAESQQGPEPVLSFVRHVVSDMNGSLGLLVVNVKVSALEALLSRDKNNPQRMLVDAGGRMLMQTGKKVSETEASQIVNSVQGESGYKRIAISTQGDRGVHNVLSVWTRGYQEGWVLIEWTPWEEITRSSVKLAKTLAAIGAGAIGVALLITLTLSRSFTSPIKQILQMMSGYTLNRSIQPYPETYQNEFGSLFSGYRKMIERVEELYQSLEQQYKAQREAEIKALQAMINPHFLYNTLDQLNWMAIEAGQERISHVLELMGRMFRIGLSNGDSFITLQEELLHIECYLQIQQLKWGEGLVYELFLEPGLETLLIPKLTIQPFVENAVTHGLHGRATGKVTVAVRRKDERTLECSVLDDGCGIPTDWNRRPIRKTGGYGIRNVMERVEAYFGHPYGVDLSPLERGGTLVKVWIPELQQFTTTGGHEDVEHRYR